MELFLSSLICKMWDFVGDVGLATMLWELVFFTAVAVSYAVFTFQAVGVCAHIFTIVYPAIAVLRFDWSCPAQLD